MPHPDHLQLARDLYGAYVSGERNVVSPCGGVLRMGRLTRPRPPQRVPTYSGSVHGARPTSAGAANHPLRRHLSASGVSQSHDRTRDRRWRHRCVPPTTLGTPLPYPPTTGSTGEHDGLTGFPGSSAFSTSASAMWS